MMTKVPAWLFDINPAKTLYVNFKIFPIKRAIKFPIAIGRGVRIGKLERGSIEIESETPFSLRLGFGGSPDLNKFRGRRSFLSIFEGGKLYVKGKAQFAPRFSILVRHSRFVLGDGFTCNNGCSFSAAGAGISFDSDCLVGGDVIVRDSDGHTIRDLDANHSIADEYSPTSREVTIGKHVWLCSNVCVLKGAQIPNNSIVAFGALCTKREQKENVVLGGIPAKIVKRNIVWER